MTERECVFCRIVLGLAPAEVVHQWPDALAIVPLNPVVKGHLLVMPTVHVADAVAAPEITAATARRAAQVATAPCNLITSVGPEATQTVRHLHWHVVPRTEGDGLALPWTAQDDRLPVVRTVGDLTNAHLGRRVKYGGDGYGREGVYQGTTADYPERDRCSMHVGGGYEAGVPVKTPCEVL